MGWEECSDGERSALGVLDVGHPALSVPPDVVRAQVRLVSTLPLAGRCALAAATPLLALGPQRRLARDPRVSVRRALAENASLVPSLQRLLAEDPNQYVKRALGENPSLCVPAASVLVGDENEYVRAALARNPAALPDLLDRLSRDRSDRVVRSVALNPSALPDTLLRLLASGDRVRLLAAWNPSTPLEAVLPLPVSTFRLAHLERRFGSDPRWETISALSLNWVGTLGELLLASGALHPLPPPSAQQ